MSLFGEIGLQEFSASLCHSVLDNTLHNLHSKLSEFAMRPNYLSQMRIAFGSSLDTNQATALANSWVKEDADSFPPIEILSSDVLHGANGAFSHLTNTIYVSNEFLTRNASNPDELTGLLLEEYGHYFSTQINDFEVIGDEGQIFSFLVQNLSKCDIALMNLRG
jgi:hypothetical protein